MPGGGPRIPGFSYRGCHRYSLTICTADRQDLFLDPDVVNWLLTHLLNIARRLGFAVLAYCVMPDHVHLLVEGRSDDADLQAFVKAFKQITGWEFRKRAGRRLWQTGYFDHVLRSDESTERHAHYIVGNPVRAGLAIAVGEYPYARIVPPEA